MKLYDTEIIEEPSEELMDFDIERSSFCVKVDSVSIKIIKTIVDTILSDEKYTCEVAYIHTFPRELVSFIGIKIISEEKK